MYVPQSAYNKAPSGQSMGGAFMSALAPAVASLVPAGSAMAPFAGALGAAVPALLNYRSQKDAAEYANQQRLDALAMADPKNNPVPRLNLPTQFTQALAQAKIAPMGEMVGQATALGSSLRSQQADTRARFASDGYQVAPEVMNAVLDNQRLGTQVQGQNALAAMADKARANYTDMLMQVGGVENSINAANNASDEDRLKTMLQLMMADTNMASLDTSDISSAINNANQLQLQYAQLAAQKQMARDQMWASLGGSAISAGGSMAGAGMISSAMKTGAKVPTGYSYS